MIARRWRRRASPTYPRPVRVCIVGAGAIGGLLATRLAVAGAEVSVLARGETLAAIRDTGLTLVEPDGSVVVAPAIDASDDLAAFGPQDVVVLSLKAHQIAAVADRLGALYAEDTIVVPVQNGLPWWFFHKLAGPFEGHRIRSLDPDGTIERHIPADRIIAGVAYPAAAREEPAVIRLVEGDRFPVGELDGSRSARVAALSQTLTAAGFTSRVLTDIRAHLWVKAWGNLAFNPISALTGATLAEICQLPSTRALAAEMMREAGAVAERLGLRLRISVEQRIEGAEKVGAHKTSMLQDVEAGRALEIAPLIGAFVELGQLTETPMPATEGVYALVSLLDARLRKEAA
jgi:2-dehydropantoate 2-reductase